MHEVYLKSQYELKAGVNPDLDGGGLTEWYNATLFTLLQDLTSRLEFATGRRISCVCCNVLFMPPWVLSCKHYN